MSDDEERSLRVRWLKMQIEKAEFDIEAERRRYDQTQRNFDRALRRQTWGIVLTAVSIAIAAFAAGHFIR